MFIIWLKKPFPLIESPRDKILLSFIIGIVVFLFLALFRPFGIDTIQEDVLLYLSGFGIISTVVTAFSFIVLPLIVPRQMNTNNWTTGKNVLLIVWILMIITILNYIYAQFLVSTVYVEALIQQENTGILAWIFMTFSVGIFPVLLIIYFAERKLLKDNQKVADEINKGIHKSPAHLGQPISLESGKDNYFNINTGDLICVRAEGGNYSTVFWQDELGIKKEFLRLTLLSFLELVHAELTIVRCHKSYVVNIEKVKNVRGNARSLTLELNGLDFEVPVSRSFPREHLANIA